MASDRHTQNATKILRVVEAMPSEGNIHILAEALARAEREGMRRAAEIAREGRVALTQAIEGMAPSSHFDGQIHAARLIEEAILSQAGERAQ